MKTKRHYSDRLPTYNMVLGVYFRVYAVSACWSSSASISLQSLPSHTSQLHFSVLQRSGEGIVGNLHLPNINLPNVLQAFDNIEMI